MKIVAVMMYTALQEVMEVVSKAVTQYKNTDFKLVVLTPVQSKLYEGAQMLVVNALPPGLDPMNIFAPIPKQGSKIAVGVPNKEV